MGQSTKLGAPQFGVECTLPMTENVWLADVRCRVPALALRGLLQCELDS